MKTHRHRITRNTVISQRRPLIYSRSCCRCCSNISVKSRSESSMCSSRNFANSGNCSACDFTDVSTIRPRTAPIHRAKARYSSTLSPVMCFIFKMERLQTIDSTLMSRAMTARRRASLESFMSEMFGSLASRSICSISGPTVSLKSCIAAFPAVSDANYSEDALLMEALLNPTPAQLPSAAAGTFNGDEIVTCVTLAPALRSASSFTSLPSSPFL